MCTAEKSLIGETEPAAQVDSLAPAPLRLATTS